MMFVWIQACSTGNGPPQRNLLVICLDMVRQDSFLDDRIRDELTPWLERGQVYSQAKTTAPWTIPSVSSALTGLWPVQHGAGGFTNPVANLDKDLPSRLDDRHVTLAEQLQTHGFQTAAFVQHPWFKSGFGLDQGFGEISFPGSTSAVGEQAMEWISDTGRGDPFFAYLHYMAAHEEHRKSRGPVEQTLAEMSEEHRQLLRNLANPAACRREKSLGCLRNQVYQDTLLKLRQSIAGILGELEKTGALEDTVVILWSDHGEAFREHRALHKTLNEDPRGMYGVGHGHGFFREVLDIPMIAWIPGVPGAKHRGLASLVDIFPSSLEWLGLPGEAYQGPGIVLPPQGSIASDRVIFASGIAFGPQSLAILDETHKAIYWPETDRFIFFDTQQDPSELNTLENDELVLRFNTLAGDYLDMAGQGGAGAPRIDSAHLEELQSVGYLQGAETTDPKKPKESDSSEE
jgi:arylsulfatase A-like enzyme